MAEENSLSILFATMLVLLLKRRQLLMQFDKKSCPIRPKRWGIRPMLMARKKFGYYENLLQEARLSDPYIFYNFTRMSATSFDKLLAIIGPNIKKGSNREPISPGCRYD